MENVSSSNYIKKPIIHYKITQKIETNIWYNRQIKRYSNYLLIFVEDLNSYLNYIYTCWIYVNKKLFEKGLSYLNKIIFLDT